MSYQPPAGPWSPPPGQGGYGGPAPHPYPLPPAAPPPPRHRTPVGVVVGAGLLVVGIVGAVVYSGGLRGVSSLGATPGFVQVRFVPASAATAGIALDGTPVRPVRGDTVVLRHAVGDVVVTLDQGRQATPVQLCMARIRSNRITLVTITESAGRRMSCRVEAG